MRPAYTSGELRAAEQPLLEALPAGVLMQRAATGLAVVCAQLLGKVYGSHVVLLVGGGNNGADALYAGAWLARRGARVCAIIAAGRCDSDGRAALVAAGGRMVAIGDASDALATADLVVDGIVGIGGTGPLRAEAATLAALAAGSGALTVAVDIPSGVDADTGRVDGVAVRADVTVTFGGWKPGLFIDPGAQLAGSVELVDIGLQLGGSPVRILDDSGARVLLPTPTTDASKYSRGVLGVAAGSGTYPGAAVLAVGGALTAGAGMVRYAGPDAATAAVLSTYPEVVRTADAASAHVQAWVVGPGLGLDDRAVEVLVDVLATDVPVLVDADALTLFARGALPAEREAPLILTPHAGELARMLDVDRDSVEADRLHHARSAADHFGAVVLLKGSTTVVADASGAVRINTSGTPWLGTAGTGDVLAGAIGAYVAQGLSPLDAAAVGAYVHGRAGQLAAAGSVPLRSGTLATFWADAERSIR